MDSAETLRQALQAARNGRELTARDLFRDVVRLDPNNEVAWIWLSGLLDPLEDRIEACERVLSINPGNGQMQTYYEKLLAERVGERQEKVDELDAKVQEIRRFIGSGRRKEAMLLLQNILRHESDQKEAWQLFAELSNSIHDKVRAYEAILKIDPADISAQKAFRRYRYFQRHPLELAAHYEEEGELDKAIDLYETLATEAGNSPEFERLYKNIVRLEDARVENVRRVKPAFTILRLSIGLPLLYVVEVFIQEGLNPIAHPTPLLWLGIPLVALGSFLLTVASVRVRHAIWRRWFGDVAGRGSGVMRALVGGTGLILVLAPHLLLILDSYQRLQAFQIPAIPWIR
jgi:tetratricopeptide (TPR) repeat protein